MPWNSIIKQVASNKLSLLLKIDLQNTQTKLKQKLFTKIIERPSEEAWVGQTECLIKEKCKCFNIGSGQRMFGQKQIQIIDPIIVLI